MSNTAYVNTGANPTWRTFPESSSSMTGKPLALVTGGSTGIGYALAQQCLRHGFSVIITAASGCRPQGAVAGTVKRDAST
jgi:NADPH:quinone reductase-like Zn-dependent oxidoreductase